MELRGVNKLLLIILTICFGCNDKQELKKYLGDNHYQIEKGDTICIYINNSSMQTYCPQPLEQLNHLKLISIKKIQDESVNCIGCTTTESLIFKGISLGNDTLIIVKPYQNQSCDEARGIKKLVDTIYFNVVKDIK
ncbi:MAG: hypothetical protein RL264_438 [Bacteroidota bacterium]|jgi:hypothetical protein